MENFSKGIRSNDAATAKVLFLRFWLIKIIKKLKGGRNLITCIEAKEIIERSGFKQKIIANKVNIHPVIFCDWLNNRRILTMQELARIEACLQKIKDIWVN